VEKIDDSKEAIARRSHQAIKERVS